MKFCRTLLIAGCVCVYSAAPGAQVLINTGFEAGWEGWQKGGQGVALSDVAHTGKQAIKLSEKAAFIAQPVALEPSTKYRLTAQLMGAGTLGVKTGPDMFFDQPKRISKDWVPLEVIFVTDSSGKATVFGSYAGAEGRFDDFSLSRFDGQSAAVSNRLLASSAGGTGLSPDLPPGRNFDLLGWYLNTPGDADGDGISDRIDEVDLAKGATDPRYFYTADDGGMVFKATVAGGKTSQNTKFTRTELREMLRRGNRAIKTKGDNNLPNKNNWVFASAPVRAQKKAGGVDGRLEATLAVNHVTTTGHKGQVGRVIVGQIHAAKDEPARLYYRKLPGNSRGAIYLAHEPSKGHGAEQFIELIGSRSDSAQDPADGIALDEKFSYVIDVKGNLLTVEIWQADTLRASTQVDMTHSGYDVPDDYMYFKAGVYNQNSTGKPDDYAQATFYRLVNTHKGYQP